jgi:2-(1,2-epoxy-1,2-dihydrophenyl)acetyl-CoA isomerase
MEYQDLLLEQQDSVLLIALNRPEQLNALGARLVHELISVLEAADRDELTKAVVITGSGRGFCSGAAQGSDPSEGTKYDEQLGFRYTLEHPIGRWGVLFTLVNSFRKPLLAAVNGVCAGGGLSLALAADIRIASPEARFISVFIRRALIPDTGTSFHLPKLIGSGRAMEMMLTGDAIDAAEADRIGLVNRVVPAEDLLPYTLDLAHRIARGPSVAIELTKKLVTDHMRDGIERQLVAEAWAINVCSQTEDRIEGARSFLEKRAPGFRGR